MGALARDTVARHSMGFIVDARPDASFVRESGGLYVSTQEGIVHVDLDGRNRRVVFPRMMKLLDPSPDGALLVLVKGLSSDLYLGDPTGAVTRVSVPGLDGRVSDAAFSPDGRTLAVTRSWDWTMPVTESPKTVDDTLYLIDVATRSVRTIPPSSHDRPTRLAWSLDGSTIWLELTTLSALWAQRIDVATGARQSVADFPEGRLRGDHSRFLPVHCPSTGSEVSTRGFGGDEGLELEEPNGKTRALVTVKGRVRVHHGEHDTKKTIDDYSFSPTCRHVVFTFGVEHIWIVDTVTGEVGPIMAGSKAVFDQRFPRAGAHDREKEP
ncbi:Hypothetical protein A7982_00038 [Minicystis rosea]|nr:Hypothetical protein A7982_00038 [Minicystis rosea]